MIELLWDISKEIITRSATSVLAPIVFSIISPFTNYKKEKKWKCQKNTCDSDKFMHYQLKVIIFVTISSIVTAFCGSLVCTYYEIELTKAVNIVRWIVSIVCACIYIFLYFVTRKQIKALSNNILFRGTNTIRKVLYYMPMVYCFWIWNIALHVNAGVYNYIINIFFIIYNIVALIVFSHKEEYPYKYAKLRFKNGCVSDIFIEDMSQNGEWIIIRKQDKEERFRYSDLEDIEYYNTSETEQRILEGTSIIKSNVL